MMSTKDLRDILSYYPASCSYTFKSELGTIRKDEWISEFMYTIAGKGHEFINDNVSDFKLQLRSISSLTDDELKQCYLEEDHRVSRIDEVDWWGIGGTDQYLRVCGLCMYFTGKFFRFTPSDPENTVRPLDSPGRLIAYLQSVGIYIPGTIDETYVQLID